MRASPFFGSDYLFEAILLPFLALSLAGVGLNLSDRLYRPGFAGSAAFMAIGAYAAFNFNLRVAGVAAAGHDLAGGAVLAAAIGVAFGLPSLGCAASTSRCRRSPRSSSCNGR